MILSKIDGLRQSIGKVQEAWSNSHVTSAYMIALGLIAIAYAIAGKEEVT